MSIGSNNILDIIELNWRDFDVLLAKRPVVWASNRDWAIVSLTIGRIHRIRVNNFIYWHLNIYLCIFFSTHIVHILLSPHFQASVITINKTFRIRKLITELKEYSSSYFINLTRLHGIWTLLAKTMHVKLIATIMILPIHVIYSLKGRNKSRTTSAKDNNTREMKNKLTNAKPNIQIE